MTFRNEVMDFVATYKAMSPTAQDRYYDLLEQEAKRKRKEEEELERQGKRGEEEYRRRVGLPPSGTPGAPQALPPSTPGMSFPAPQQAAVPPQGAAINTNWPEFAPAMRRGGMVRKHADGGPIKALRPGQTWRPRQDEPPPFDQMMWNIRNKEEWKRPPRPGEPMNQRDDDEGQAYRRGGAVKRFDSGGQVTAEDERSEADLILRGIMNRDIGTPDYGADAGQQYRREARPDEVTSEMVGPGEPTELNPHSPIGGYGPPVQPDQPLGPSDVAAIKTTTPPPVRKSPYRAWIEGEGGIDEDARAAREKTEEWQQRMNARKAARRGAGAVAAEERQHVFEPQTPEQRRESLERSAAAEATRNETRPPDVVYPQRTEELQALDTRPPVPQLPPVATPPGSGAPVLRNNRGQAIDDEGNVIPEPAAPPRVRGPETETGGTPDVERPTTPYPAVTPAPSVYGKVPGPPSETGGAPEAASPKPYPTKPGQPNKPAQTSSAGGGGGGGGGGAGGGNTGPGSGNGSVPAPPPGGRTEDPRTRVAAFDPGRERINPDQTTGARQFNAQGQVVPPTPQEMQTMIATAAQGRAGPNGEAPPIGSGAVGRDTLQSLVGEYRQGGQYSEGQALMAGMHAKYRYLLSKGRAKEAAQMAWGLIQAANLEAASLGMVARDQARSGDLAGSRQTLAKALDWAPDGTTHKASANGIDTYDASGRLVNRAAVDAKTALALSLGLSDGTLIWNALSSAAETLMPKDKGAEGRALSNELRRLQIEGAKRKLAGGGGKGGTGESQQARDLRHYLATGQIPKSDGGGGGGGGSDNDQWVFANPAGDREEGDG
jgi:hypothetical protein